MGVFICICWRVEDATKKRKESAGGEKLNSTIEITGREMKGKKKRFQIEGFRDVYICNNNTILLLWGDRNSSAYTQHTQKRREEN